ncbi:MAG: methyltransferase domain-containing protein [Solirubrobacterales bacterium]|nr:methyltransferase domain-containing protein [Solirubrobacterales bacterium]
MQDAASTGGCVIDPNAVYSLGSSSGESERLQRQAEELASESEALLDQVELGPGDSAIDLGCGPRGVLELLHRRVSPGGRVVGLDSDPAHVEMAAEFVSKRRLDGVEVVTADARKTGLQEDSFDVVHARTLLINVPEPEKVLVEMVRLTRPGGWVASLEPDCEHSIYYPHHPVFDRLHELFITAFSRNGADPLIGRRLGELYRQAGLEDVGIDVRSAAYPLGQSRRTVIADLVRAMRPQILALGAADERELDELDATARRRLDNPEVVAVNHMRFLAWGRKPAIV